MPSWRDEIAKLSPVEIRERNRAIHRLEVGQPEAKWKIFREQCRKEQKGLQAMEWRLDQKRDQPPDVVKTLVKRLRYAADRREKWLGGGASVLLRRCFLHWDGNRSGKLNVAQLIAAVSQLGVSLTQQEAGEVVAYYAPAASAGKKPTEMPYSPLLQDAANGGQRLLEVDPLITVRLLGSSRSEGALMGTSKPTRNRSAVVRAFRAKLRQVVGKHMRDVGGSQYSILRRVFLNWDIDQSGKTAVDELRGALQSLNMRISAAQAQEVVRFYAEEGSPESEFHYMDLVNDICEGDNGPLAHEPEKPGPEPGKIQQWLEQDGLPHLIFHKALSRMFGEWATPTAPMSTNRSSEESDRTGDVHFTARCQTKPPNRVVETCKLKLRDALERTIKRKGGVHHAIIREAFLAWDMDSSGRLNPKELTGALNRMGVRVSEEEAIAIVNHYDLDNSGEMNYEVLCTEIKALSHSILSYIEDVDVLAGLGQTVQEPPKVQRILERIRHGVVAAVRRATGDELSKISPPDLLEGTCLRFDPQRTGILEATELRQVWRELKIDIRGSETSALVAWLDQGIGGQIGISELGKAVFGDQTTHETATTSLKHACSHGEGKLLHRRRCEDDKCSDFGAASGSGKENKAQHAACLPPLARQSDRPTSANKGAWNCWDRPSPSPPSHKDRKQQRTRRRRNVTTREEEPRERGTEIVRTRALTTRQRGRTTCGTSRRRRMLNGIGVKVMAEKVRIKRRLRELQEETKLLRRRRKQD